MRRARSATRARPSSNEKRSRYAGRHVLAHTMTDECVGSHSPLDPNLRQRVLDREKGRLTTAVSRSNPRARSVPPSLGKMICRMSKPSGHAAVGRRGPTPRGRQAPRRIPGPPCADAGRLDRETERRPVGGRSGRETAGQPARSEPRQLRHDPWRSALRRCANATRPDCSVCATSASSSSGCASRYLARLSVTVSSAAEVRAGEHDQLVFAAGPAAGAAVSAR